MELALCLPVLALLVTAIVQLGVAFNRYITLTDAVRVAARAAAVDGGSTAAAQSALQQAAPDLSLAAPPQVRVSGSDVTVTASAPYSIGIFGLPLTSGLLTSSTTERVE